MPHNPNRFRNLAQRLTQPRQLIVEATEAYNKSILDDLLSLLDQDGTAWYIGQLIASPDPDWIDARKELSYRLRQNHNYKSDYIRAVTQKSKIGVRTIVSLRDPEGDTSDARHLAIGPEALVQIEAPNLAKYFGRENSDNRVAGQVKRGRKHIILSPDDVSTAFTEQFEAAARAALRFSQINEYGGTILNALIELTKNWANHPLDPDTINDQLVKFIYNN